MPKKVYDIIIVGCGPAGMAACLYAARQKLNFICISKDVGGLANLIPHIETYLGYHYLSGFDLIERFREHIEGFKIKNVSEEVVKIEKAKKLFAVRTDKNNYYSKSLIIATGRKPKKLGIKGEDKFDRRGISYCTACDGPLFRNKEIAIIGGGRSGLLSALFVKDIVKKVYLIEMRKELGGTHAWREAVRKSRNIKILTNTTPVEIMGNKFASSIALKKGNKKEILKVDGIFIEAGYVSNTAFLKNLVKINDRKEIIIDKENQTNLKGIFAAGDCTDIQEKQVVVAVGEGAKALLSVLRYLGLHEESKTHLQSIIKK